MPEEKRQAVVVGINKYKDPNIPPLTGAVNDAEEMRQRLKDFGEFEIADNHFLTDSKATCNVIRKAISDLLWQTDSCDLALFYFSGHGFVDSQNNLYIAPCDMVRAEPLVCGISMLELKQIFLDSVNKSGALMILDCCHSGVATKGGAKVSYDAYFEKDKERMGEGKIILASSEGDDVSREKPDCTHGNESNPHPHGVFTFHLLEGLDGKASDENGLITLDRLHKHVEDALIDTGKQKPKFFAADASGTSKIRIAKDPKKHETFINNILEDANKTYDDNDLSCLIHCTIQISSVLNISPNNQKAIKLKNKISTDLPVHQDKIQSWLIENQAEVRPKTKFIFPVIQKLPNHLNFEGITKLDKTNKALLLALFSVTIGEYSTDEFIKQCQRFNNPPSSSSSPTGTSRP